MPHSRLKLASSRSVAAKRKMRAAAGFCAVSNNRNKVHVARVCFDKGVSVMPCCWQCKKKSSVAVLNNSAMYSMS